MSSSSPAPNAVTFSRLVTVVDANLLGTIHGGVILKEIDSAAGAAAARHAGRVCVTAAIGKVSFHQPVHVGDVLEVTAHVTAVGRTSVEVTVEVHAVPYGGGERRHTTTAALVMVALGDDGRPHPVPPLGG